MSFTAAALIALLALTLFLGLIAYNLLQRLEQLESALAGGLGAAERTLNREEFARRWRIAIARSGFARNANPGVHLFIDPAHDHAAPLVDAMAALPTLEHLHTRVPMDADPSALIGPLTAATRTDPDTLQSLHVTVLPYAMVIDAGRILEAGPVGAPDRLAELMASAS